MEHGNWDARGFRGMGEGFRVNIPVVAREMRGRKGARILQVLVRVLLLLLLQAVQPRSEAQKRGPSSAILKWGFLSMPPLLYLHNHLVRERDRDTHMYIYIYIYPKGPQGPVFLRTLVLLGKLIFPSPGP